MTYQYITLSSCIRKSVEDTFVTLSTIHKENVSLKVDPTRHTQDKATQNSGMPGIRDSLTTLFLTQRTVLTLNLLKPQSSNVPFSIAPFFCEISSFSLNRSCFCLLYTYVISFLRTQFKLSTLSLHCPFLRMYLIEPHCCI